MITNLANYFFEYTMIENNPELKYYKLNHFTYIISERYTLDNVEYFGNRSTDILKI